MTTSSFNWNVYLKNYPDLGSMDQLSALKHYKKFGKSEGRTDKCKDELDTVIISGEKIQLQCDYFIGTREDISFNPLIQLEVTQFPDKWIDLMNYKNKNYKNKNIPLKNNLKIFCYTWILENWLSMLIDIFSKIDQPFELYFHNSDGNFLPSHYTILKELSCIKKIYAQNNTVLTVFDEINPVLQVVTLPIGQANSQWIHGNSQILLESINNPVQKENHIYLNFSITHPSRIACKRSLMGKGIPWIEDKKYPDYIKTLATYKFCICVEGNGLDTHRFWECLYLGVLPICIKNEWTDVVKDKFPMILLDSWEDLNPKLLREIVINQSLNINGILNLNTYI